MIEKVKDRALMAYHIARYQIGLFFQSGIAQILSLIRKDRLKTWPEITLFTSSLNTLWPLKLTLASMKRWSDYHPKHFLFGENASTDGSFEFLNAFIKDKIGSSILRHEPKPHGLWLDEALRLAQTPYLLFVDSDLLFFSGNVVQEAVAYMEVRPDCWLLAADRRPGSPYPEDPEIFCPEALSTWFCIVRTSLREKISATFLGQYGQEKGPSGKPLKLYECGALVLEEMREKNLAYDVMPWSMRQKFYHFGNLSWVGNLADQSNRYARMKQYQIKDIQRRLNQLSQIVEQ